MCKGDKSVRHAGCHVTPGCWGGGWAQATVREGGRGRDYTIGFPSSRFYIPIGIYPAAIPYSTTRLITYRLFYH